jgi:hypothetical protein
MRIVNPAESGAADRLPPAPSGKSRVILNSSCGIALTD